MLSKYIPVAANEYYSFIYICVYVHTHTHTHTHHIFSHCSVDGHLGCLHVLAIINSVAMNYEHWGTHISFQISVFVFGYISRSGIAEIDFLNVQTAQRFPEQGAKRCLQCAAGLPSAYLFLRGEPLQVVVVLFLLELSPQPSACESCPWMVSPGSTLLSVTFSLLCSQLLSTQSQTLPF